jgi:hypothetical protein
MTMSGNNEPFAKNSVPFYYGLVCGHRGRQEVAGSAAGLVDWGGAPNVRGARGAGLERGNETFRRVANVA